MSCHTIWFFFILNVFCRQFEEKETIRRASCLLVGFSFPLFLLKTRSVETSSLLVLVEIIFYLTRLYWSAKNKKEANMPTCLISFYRIINIFFHILVCFIRIRFFSKQYLWIRMTSNAAQLFSRTQFNRFKYSFD